MVRERAVCGARAGRTVCARWTRGARCNAVVCGACVLCDEDGQWGPRYAPLPRHPDRQRPTGIAARTAARAATRAVARMDAFGLLFGAFDCCGSRRDVHLLAESGGEPMDDCLVLLFEEGGGELICETMPYDSVELPSMGLLRIPVPASSSKLDEEALLNALYERLRALLIYEEDDPGNAPRMDFVKMAQEELVPPVQAGAAAIRFKLLCTQSLGGSQIALVRMANGMTLPRSHNLVPRARLYNLMLFDDGFSLARADEEAAATVGEQPFAGCCLDRRLVQALRTINDAHVDDHIGRAFEREGWENVVRENTIMGK